MEQFDMLRPRRSPAFFRLPAPVEPRPRFFFKSPARPQFLRSVSSDPGPGRSLVLIKSIRAAPTFGISLPFRISADSVG